MIKAVENQAVKARQVECLVREAQILINNELGEANAKLLSRVRLLSERITDKRNNGIVSSNDVKEAIDELDKLITGDGDLEKLGRSLLLKSTISHGLSDFQKSESTPSIVEKMKADIKALVLNSNNPLETLQRAEETMRIMVQRQTHTYHPVVYQTLTARSFLQEVTTLLQSAKQSEAGIFGSAIDAVRKKIDGLVKGVMGENRALTPQRKIGIGDEGAFEVENIRAMRNNLAEMQSNWNQALQELNADEEFVHDYYFPDDKAELSRTLRGMEISEENNNKDRWIFSTWGGRIPSADSDGRREATSHALSRSIYGGCVKEGDKLVFKDVAHDMRIASEVGMNAVGALIRRAYLASRGKDAKYPGDKDIPSADGQKFARFVSKFVRRAFGSGQASANGQVDWTSSRASDDYLYQELPTEKRAEFCRDILLNDQIELLPDEIKNLKTGYVVRFNLAYQKILWRYGKEDVGFGNIDPITKAKIINDLASAGFSLTKDGRGYDILIDPLDENGNPLFVRDFLAGSWVLDGNGKHKQLAEDGTITVVDAVRRFIVINEALTDVENGNILCPDEDIANRCQMANFNCKANFYEMMLLYKQSGLLEIKDEKVTKVKMGIQPLIETIKDMRNAPQIFRELLQDPLIESYYRTRGFAEFMIGFSDGAKSAGNLGSEWALYNVQRELKAIFSEKFGPDFVLDFFEGRGRRENRGGSIDPKLSAQMTPDELAIQAIRDETIQGDHAGEAYSNPDFGVRDVYGRMMGTLVARERACTTSDAKKQEMGEHEKTINFLADFAAAVFEQKVPRHSNIEIFINGMPFNGYISSRASVRPDSSVNGYEAQRAVPVEAMGAEADLPFHYVGMGEAINAFLDGGDNIEIKEYDEKTKEYVIRKQYNLSEFGGHEERKARLSKLSEHPWMDAFLKRTQVGLSNFHPEIAAVYGDDITKSPGFVNSSIESLQGLKDRIDYLKPARMHGQESSGSREGRWAEYTSGNGKFKEITSAVVNSDAEDIEAHLLIGVLAKRYPNLSTIDVREHPLAQSTLNDCLAINFTKYAEAGLEQEAGVSR